MADEMTLKEAVRLWERSRDERIAVNLGAIIQAFAAHAERTLAARGEEPEWVRVVRDDVRDHPEAHYSEEIGVVCFGHARDVVHYIDTLTARLHAVTQERDALVEAIDREMVTACIGTFAHGDDANAALKELIAWAHGVGAYFAKESPNA